MGKKIIDKVVASNIIENFANILRENNIKNNIDELEREKIFKIFKNNYNYIGCVEDDTYIQFDIDYSYIPNLSDIEENSFKDYEKIIDISSNNMFIEVDYLNGEISILSGYTINLNDGEKINDFIEIAKTTL